MNPVCKYAYMLQYILYILYIKKDVYCLISVKLTTLCHYNSMISQILDDLPTKRLNIFIFVSSPTETLWQGKLI